VQSQGVNGDALLLVVSTASNCGRFRMTLAELKHAFDIMEELAAEDAAFKAQASFRAMTTIKGWTDIRALFLNHR
jgi:hypothetical protein